MSIKSLRQYYAPDIAELTTARVILQEDVNTFATPSSLPQTGNKQGIQAYVLSNQGLYIWTGTEWKVISVINSNLTLTQAAESSYALSISGAPTYVNLAATSSNSITWNYTITDGAMGNVTIDQTDNVFLITPGASADNFTVNFSAVDSTGIVGSTTVVTVT